MLFTVSSEGIYSTTIFYSSISISGSLYFHSTTFLLYYIYLLTLDISYFADYKVLVPNNIISLLLLFV